MIDQLIAALNKEIGLSAEEIADTLWLAMHGVGTSSESGQSQHFNPNITEDESDKLSQQESSDNLENQTLTSEPESTEQATEKKAGIYNQKPNKSYKSLEISFKVPDAPSLREQLDLARALRPLMRRIPSGSNFVLDEAATTQRIANEGIWLPVLTPTLEPWLDLELVIDESISMQIWRNTIKELERLLKSYGIFRDVRIWGLISNKQNKIQLRRGIGATAKNQPPRSAAELIDSSGRRLILVVSDCVSDLWRNGHINLILETWANNVPTAIIQMLPKWFWDRTALGRSTEVKLQGLAPSVSNRQLIANTVSLWSEIDETTAIKVPVFTLEPERVANWAQMLVGKGSVQSTGYVFKPEVRNLEQDKPLFSISQGELTAEKRVQAFRVTASPMARKLAGLLASAPVISLPVVRLIRETMLKDSQQVHVAEVFLGGLLKPLTDIEVDTDPNYVQYDFIDGVRELLVDSVPSSYVLNVVEEVSKFVAKKVGLSLSDFAAVLRNPEQVSDRKLVEQVQPFAMVTAQILRSLGGEYEKFAAQITPSLIPTTLTKNLRTTNLDIVKFFGATNPAETLNIANAEDRKYYIDFTEVRGSNIIREIKRTITFSGDDPTCQLFTGQIGCGKSTELSRLKTELEMDGFHVVYFESSQDLDMTDVDISDILLAIALHVSQSLEVAGINLKPTYLHSLLQDAANFLNSSIADPKFSLLQISKVGISANEEQYSLAFSIGKITDQAKSSLDIRSLLRQYLEPRLMNILEAINEELIASAQRQLKQQGKEGLVVLVDNLDRIDNRLKLGNRTQPEYLFVDRGEQLKKLQCHLVYTIPLTLVFSKDKENLTNRFGSDPKLLSMVRVRERDGSICQLGINLLRQMILCRAFPELGLKKRESLITQLVDSPETLDRLCLVSGGHVRTLLLLLHRCILQDDLPLSRSLVERVINQHRASLVLGITPDKWELIWDVARNKSVRGDNKYPILLWGLFVLEYRDQDERWFDINPILEGAKELSH